jgi:hypothetical protein
MIVDIWRQIEGIDMKKKLFKKLVQFLQNDIKEEKEPDSL